MKKERIDYYIECDVCGDIKKDPTAVSGLYDSGWVSTDKENNFDLCPVCYGVFVSNALGTISEKKIKKIIEDLIDTTEKKVINDWNLSQIN